jgi:hypothetical protein
MTKKNLLAVAATLLVVFLLGCPQQKKIGEINQDPQRYVNKDIAIKGTVVKSAGAVVLGLYQVDDGTGTMWVVSNGNVPAKGSKIGVSGRIEPGFSFGGQSYGTTLREKERRY